MRSCGDGQGRRITDHRGEFSFCKWLGQALGLPGRLLGSTPIISGATHKKARAALDEFIAGQS